MCPVADDTVRLWAGKALRQLGDDRGLASLQTLAAANLPVISELARRELAY